MSPTQSLTQLAARISSNATDIEEYLRSKDLASPSFGIDAPIEFPAPAGEQKIQKARGALLQDCSTLFDLILGPGDYFRYLIFRFLDISTIRFLYHYKIPQAVPLEGGTSQDEIAKATGLDERRVRSIMRHAMTNRIFDQDAAGNFVHTAHSAMMVRDSTLWDLVGFVTEEAFPSSVKAVESLERYPRSDEPTQSPFSLAMDIQDSAFGYYAKNATAQTRFFGAMQYAAKAHIAGVEHVISGYDWAAEGDATVVDVGGSTGHVSVSIASQFPALKFVVQDMQETVAAGEESLPDELRGRVTYMAHDFFTPQSVKGDIYMLRSILHDWPDKHAIRILQNLLPSMKERTKILILEVVFAPPKQLPPLQEKMISIFDHLSWNHLNSGERSEEDWRELLNKADSRLRLSKIIKPPGSIQSIIEVHFTPNE